MVQWKRIQLETMRLRASLSGLRIWHSHELWCTLAAIAPIRPLAWQPPYVAGVALKKQIKKHGVFKKAIKLK